MTKRRPFLIGLTGSIGMGKSTTAKMFADEGIPTWDADAAVHRMYDLFGAAVEPLKQVFPDAIIDNKISRDVLKTKIQDDPTALGTLEKIVHPLVAQDRAQFIENAKTDIVLLDIPLLFETASAPNVDVVVVVSAPEDLQRHRVLARPGMTDRLFETILQKQMPDSEKRALADYVIETITPEATRVAVTQCITDIRRKLNDA